MSNWQFSLEPVARIGEIEQCIGLKLVANGPPGVFIGELCEIMDSNLQIVARAEVVGFEHSKVYLMPFSKTRIRMGFKVRATGRSLTIDVDESLLGRVVNALGQPLDDEGNIPCYEQITIDNASINPLLRERIQTPIATGIHAIDGLLPLGKGQRIGLFAGSGVGKSQLLGMMANHMHADVRIIALIGERGREVHDFIHHHLHEDTRKKTIIIAACSDDFALMRKQAVLTATAMAEYFCQKGQDVVLFVDSITRFAMALREIGLSLGEPPTARGYTPSVFSTLPMVIERAGNFQNKGSITAIYTVLVEGDDFNEPITDAMRSLLDGHIVLTRELAQLGHYPAIDVLLSVSRLSKDILPIDAQDLVKQIVAILSIYAQNKDLIELGAYVPGQNMQLDEAVTRIDAISSLLKQGVNDTPLPTTELLKRFRDILS